MTALTQVTDASFDAQVLKCDIPILVDFWAEWCGPCRAIAPYLDEIVSEYANQIKIVKLDVDANPLIPATYGVLGLPTLILFKFGQPVERLTGTQTKGAILDKIAPYLDR
ncbi:MAG: thioredoxin [Dehalococcoidia bacterium]|nr:MAG: thioredoxin [Dehalococcoidia bacterium]